MPALEAGGARGRARRSTRRSPPSRTCRTTTCRSARTSTATSSATASATRANFASAEGAFRDRRGARPDGFRDGGEAVGLALRGAEGPARAAGARARPVHARPAHDRARLHGGGAAAAGARRGDVRHGAAAEVRGRPVLRPLPIGSCDENCRSSSTCCSEDHVSTRMPLRASCQGRDRFWLIPTAEVPLTNLVREADPRRGRTAAALHRADALLPRRGRRAGTRHARHAAPAPVHEDASSSRSRRRRQSARRARAHARLRRGSAEAPRPAVSAP